MALIELWYWLFNTPYYKVLVTKDMEKIKYIVQKVATKEKGKDAYIIDTKLKKAWWNMPEVCFRDNKKFLMTVDLDNAVPLMEESKLVTEGVMKDIFVREISIDRLTNSTLTLEDMKKYNGKPYKFAGASFPPQLLFEITKGTMVTNVLSNPPSAWEEKKWVFIAAVAGLVVVVYLILSSGVLNSMGGV